MESGSKAITPSIRRKLSILLENLRKDHNFEIFVDPIDPIKDGCLDYFQVIKCPMDLSTISRKLMDNEYNNISEFHKDIMLVFSNCREYNTSPLCSHIIDLCENSEKRFVLEWNKLDFVDKISISSSRKNDKESDKNGSIMDLGRVGNQRHITPSSTSSKSKPRAKPNSNTNSTQIPKSQTSGLLTIRIERQTGGKRQKNDESPKFTSLETATPIKRRKEDLRKFSGEIGDGNGNDTTGKDQDWRKECLRILNIIRKEDNSFLFENPVLESSDLTQETKDKYREIISEPCDYSTVEKGLLEDTQSGKKRRDNESIINDPHEFERLIKLIFSNCMLFNPNTGDCKWIFDTARQTLNKFISVWNKSNVFKMYSDLMRNKGAVDSESDFIETGGNEGGKQMERKLGRGSNSEPCKNFSLSSDTLMERCRKQDYLSESGSASSLTKIVQQWNDFSVRWRQSVLDSSKLNMGAGTSRKTGMTTRNSKKSEKLLSLSDNPRTTTTKTPRNSRERDTTQGGGTGSWRGKKKVMFSIPVNSTGVRGSPGFSGESGRGTHNLSSVSDYFSCDSGALYEVPIKMVNSSFDTENSNKSIEYTVPIRIFHMDRAINGPAPVLGEGYCYHHVNNTVCSEYLNCNKVPHFNLHRYTIRDTRYNAEICINSFETDCKETNVIKSVNFVAFSNHQDLRNKCMELKIRTLKQINKTVFPVFSHYFLNGLLVVCIKFVVSDFVTENEGSYGDKITDSAIHIHFGEVIN